MNKYFLCVLFILILDKKFSHGQNISTDQIKAGDIVDKKYAAFDLGEYQKGQDRAYFVKFIGNISNLQMICFSRDLGATPITVQEELELFLLKDGKIIDKRHELFCREKNPEFGIVQDNFIQYIELKHKWFENDVGNMSYNSENDYIDGLRYIVKEEKIVPLTDLSKAELRIYRNLIFAKYGYIFKSEDLNTYFKAKDWYKPNGEIKVDQVMNESEKELVSYILKLESAKHDEKHLQNSKASSNEKDGITWTDDKHGYIIDSRDKKKYKIVKIGNQTWMAENLAFDSGIHNRNYDDNIGYVEKYGHLYSWETPHSDCPIGWSLPNKTDFETLLNNYGGEGYKAYHELITGGSSGFSATFAGLRNSIGDIVNIEKIACFLISSVESESWYFYLSNDLEEANLEKYNENFGFSVRCLKDN